MTQIKHPKSYLANLCERADKLSSRSFWTQCAAGVVLIVVAISVDSREYPGVEVLCVFGLALIISGPTKLTLLGKSIKEAFDHFNNGSGGFGPPGVPVESALRIPAQPKRKDPEPPLPPL